MVQNYKDFTSFLDYGGYYNNMLALPRMLKTRKREDVGVLVVYIRPYQNILHDVNRQTMKSILFLP